MSSCARMLAVIFLGLLAAGCGGTMLVDPAKPASVGDGISVMPQVQWNQISVPGQTVWTQNGFSLDTLHFVTGVKAGNALYPLPGLDKDRRSIFDANMLPNDIQDLVVSTLEKEGYQNVRSADLAPCPFGGAPGFCFDLDFSTPDGLLMKGKVIASKRSDKLDMFEFRAPAEYYFGSLASTVGQVFASVTVK